MTIVRGNSLSNDAANTHSTELNISAQISVDPVNTLKQEDCVEDLDGPSASPPTKTKEPRGKPAKGPKGSKGTLSRRQKILAAAAQEYEQASQIAQDMTREQLLVEKMTEKNPARLRVIKKALLLTAVRSK